MELEMRLVMNAILYIVVTGCQWRNLPNDFPNPKSVYYHYRKWCRDGTWYHLNRQLGYLERRRVGRLPRPSAGIIDSQSVKTTDVGGVSGYDGNKRLNGRKRHILVDTLGNLLAVSVSAASEQDRAGAIQLLTQMEPLTVTRLLKIWADKGYQGDWATSLYQKWRIHLDIVRRQAGQKGFVVLPRRWVVERTFAWFGKHRRLSKDYERCTTSSEGMIYLASIRILLNRMDT
jgi:putative transposase